MRKYQTNVSMGPHPKGSPVEAKEKRCILNLYQSYKDDGKTEKEARHETVRRLGFGHKTVRLVIKEVLSEGGVTDNKYARATPNAYEKLDEEEIEDIRKIVHGEMQKCNDVKRLTAENHDLKYPTVESLHKVVQDTERYPSWSVTTFRNILLSMGLHFKTKSETDSAILIESQNIIDWHDRFLDHMEQYRIEGRPIHYQNELHVDPFRQPKKLLVDITVESAVVIVLGGRGELVSLLGLGATVVVLEIGLGLPSYF